MKPAYFERGHRPKDHKEVLSVDLPGSKELRAYGCRVKGYNLKSFELMAVGL